LKHTDEHKKGNSKGNNPEVALFGKKKYWNAYTALG
jgi:hypothetical protein